MLPVASYTIRERGATPRGMAKATRAAQKEAWYHTGVQFVAEHADRRFTHAHASAAGYKKRTEAYTRRKLNLFGHTYPLEYSGQTRLRVRTANLTSTANGNRIRFPQARRLNIRNTRAKDPIDMKAEFTRVPQREADELAAYFDGQLDSQLNDNKTTTETALS